MKKILCKAFGHRYEGTVYRAVSKIIFAIDGEDLSGIWVDKNDVCTRCKDENRRDSIPTDLVHRYVKIPLLDVYWPNEKGKIVLNGLQTGQDYVEKWGAKELYNGTLYPISS